MFYHLKFTKKLKATIFQVAFGVGAALKLSFYTDLYLIKTDTFYLCHIVLFNAF